MNQAAAAPSASLPVPDIDDVNRPYFAGTAVGELRICHCPRCDALFRFAHACCPNCWFQNPDFVVSSGRGEVETFTVVHQAPYESFTNKIPYVIALIQLSEGVRMMSNIVGCDPDSVQIGMPVKVTFEKRGAVHLPMFIPDSRV